jgi:hypothetical protein
MYKHVRRTSLLLQLGRTSHTQNVINQFMTTGSDPRISFLGNITLGRDVSLEELRSIYPAVVLAYGAESDRKLGASAAAFHKPNPCGLYAFQIY